MDLLDRNFISSHFDPLHVGTRANRRYVEALEYDASREIYEKLLST